jgi:hypothetical protein
MKKKIFLFVALAATAMTMLFVVASPAGATDTSGGSALCGDAGGNPWTLMSNEDFMSATGYNPFYGGDLNGDGYVCAKQTNGNGWGTWGWMFKDDIQYKKTA